MNTRQLEELLLQSLEHERGGVWIYQAALQCVLNPDVNRAMNAVRVQQNRLEQQ